MGNSKINNRKKDSEVFDSVVKIRERVKKLSNELLEWHKVTASFHEGWYLKKKEIYSSLKEVYFELIKFLLSIIKIIVSSAIALITIDATDLVSIGSVRFIIFGLGIELAICIVLILIIYFRVHAIVEVEFGDMEVLFEKNVKNFDSIQEFEKSLRVSELKSIMSELEDLTKEV